MEIDVTDFEWARGLWGPFVDQARQSQQEWPPRGTTEERLAHWEDEREIERVFRRYHHFYDGHDVDGILSCFTEDAVQINGRGTFIGRESVRRSYEYLIANQRIIFHFGTGVLVSFDEQDPDAAVLTARHFDVWVPTTGSAHAAGGTYINRMRRVEDGRWLIAEQRITFNFKFDVTLTARELGSNAAPPDHPLNQSDLLEDKHLLA